mmetsp:Transcript_10952/g.29384  ORF Transcript_10952/g.29384 Transcript_10952/m.29384 type:complete len:238 (-) Transcript_10952:119-832(-)
MIKLSMVLTPSDAPLVRNSSSGSTSGQEVPSRAWINAAIFLRIAGMPFDVEYAPVPLQLSRKLFARATTSSGKASSADGLLRRSGQVQSAKSWRMKVSGGWPTACGLPMLHMTTSGNGRDSPASSAATCCSARCTILPRTAYSISVTFGFSSSTVSGPREPRFAPSPFSIASFAFSSAAGGAITHDILLALTKTRFCAVPLDQPRSSPSATLAALKSFAPRFARIRACAPFDSASRA